MKLFIAIIVIIVIIIPIFFLCNDLFYDQSGPWLDIWSQKVKIETSANLIEQKITPLNNDFSMITIPIRVIKKSSLEASILNNEGSLLASQKFNIQTAQQKIEWEFAPLGGRPEIYILRIRISDDSANNIKFFLVPAESLEKQVLINDQIVSDKTLAYFTESKFGSFKEKLKALYERAKIYKPQFIQIMQLPFFILYIISFSLFIWSLLTIIVSDN